jgi:hypothetical protein
MTGLTPFGPVLLFLAASAAAAGAPSANSDLMRRIGTRGFPSVFEAWSPADNLKGEDPVVTFARHDLAIVSPEELGLRWNDAYRGLATGFRPATMARARAIRARLLRLNPHMVLIAEIRYRDAPGNYLPGGSDWWRRRDGARAPGWAEGHYFLLDFGNPGFQAQVARQARAAMATGVFDGVFFDWWQDDDDRLALVRGVRAAVGDAALILVNANDLPRPRSAPYINGYYMECWRSRTAKDWRRMGRTLQWAEGHLRPPRVDCVETWYRHSRRDLDLMRATTTLTLTMSDGYCLFGDPDSLPTPDHLHDWYDFWGKRLGRPVAPGFKRADGAWEREFEKGSAVYDPMGNRAVVVRFEGPRRRLSTGETAARFVVPACDGDLFLRLPDGR